MILIVLSLAWVAGIWLGYYFDLPLWLGLIGLIPLAAVFLSHQHRKALALAGIGVIIFVAASGYSYSSLYSVDEGKLRYYNDTDAIKLKGIISGDPDVRDTSARLTVSAQSLKLESGWQPVSGKIMVLVPRYPAYSYGDALDIEGKLETPSSVDDFDYRGYLAHQGIYSTLYYPAITVEAKNKGLAPLSWIYSLRGALSKALAQALPEPQASLAQGILLGERANIPADLQQDFSVSGTTHLLAISGMNIGIMAGVLLAVGLWLFKRRHYLYIWLTLAVIWFYAIISGLNAPVLRGAFMASIFLMGEGLGRQRSGMIALLLAAAVMAGANPYVLGDASFQLSFLAMAGLCFIYPIIQENAKKLTDRMGENGFWAGLTNMLLEAFGVTFAAVIAVWPVIAYYFGYVSLVGPIATFLLSPALAIIIVLGSATGLVGLLWAGGAQAIGWLAWLFLSYMIAVVNIAARPGAAAVSVHHMQPWFITVYYIVLIALVWLYARWRRSKNIAAGTAGRMRAGISLGGLAPGFKLFVVPVALIGVIIFCSANAAPLKDLKVSFLDVGEGDAELIQYRGYQVLVDGGPSPKAITLALGKEMPFWDRTIDVVVLTHPHQDHLAGLLEVLQRYDVGQVIYPHIDYDSPVYDQWKKVIAEKGIKSTAARAGETLTLGGEVKIEVLNPPEKLLTGTESDVDNNSVVLKVRDGAVSFLLTGDIMSEGERELIRGRAELSATVVKAGHHGSATSSTDALLAVVNPKAAVIECGAGNKFGHPEKEVVERLEQRVGSNLYRTDLNGTVDFTTDGVKLWVK
ncbi:MAG TPA: DNA internalization-related competence protein ComEC/Rec2 [Dehalococcoidales bacterium]|nr:DNA internalization-related competence protein ComEC/Rec2 [Dehalococcoidales bacterium]